MTRKSDPTLQVDDGNFTRIHNLIIEAIAYAPLSSRELKVVLAVVRLTYGFNRKAVVLDAVKIAGMAGLYPQHVKATIAKLIDCRVLVLNEGAIGINKQLDEWACAKRQHGPQVGAQTSTQIGVQIGVQSGLQFGDGSSNLESRLVPKMGKNTPVEPARGADPGKAKDRKTERHDATALSHEGEELLDPTGGESGSIAPAHVPPHVMRELAEDASPPAYLEGFGQLAARFIRYTGKGGVILPGYQNDALRAVLTRLGITAREALALFDRFDADVAAGKKHHPDKVSTPRYFEPIFQEYLADDAAPRAEPTMADRAAKYAQYDHRHAKRSPYALALEAAADAKPQEAL